MDFLFLVLVLILCLVLILALSFGFCSGSWSCFLLPGIDVGFSVYVGVGVAFGPGLDPVPGSGVGVASGHGPDLVPDLTWILIRLR